MKGREEFFHGLCMYCTANRLAVPHIAVVSNQGGVGLRAAMEGKQTGGGTFADKTEQWGNNAAKYPTFYEARERVFEATKLISDIFRKNNAAGAKQVRGYYSCAYRSLKSGNWFPPTDRPAQDDTKYNLLRYAYAKAWRVPNTGMLEDAMTNVGLHAPTHSGQVCMVGDQMEDKQAADKFDAMAFCYADGSRSGSSDGFFTRFQDN